MKEIFKSIDELKNDNFFTMNEIEQTEYLRANGFFKLENSDKIAFLESMGLFYLDINEDPPTIPLDPDKVDYLRKKISSKIKSKVTTKYGEHLVKNLIKEKKLIIKAVEGIENMQKVQSGAILTCNHFNPYDCFTMELMFRKSGQNKNKKIFKIIREGNYTNFPGLYGFFFRNCDTLPLGSTKKAMSCLINAVDTILKRGDFVLIYPEQSMWWNYKQPKPLKNGSFNFAAKSNVPVIPSFITFEDSDVIGEDGSPVQEYTVHIGEPIYPNSELSAKENMKMIRDKNYAFWKDTYEKAYGKKLEYSTIKYDELPKYVEECIDL
ncbi:MAG: 1-acyl-sn-glycerol-3-phosphate acyltransferase [Clostridia bacterium]|nr:1-acyl-sn-glycerol-3-phosphate acyltransferase [Clostridia bacterium]